MKKKFPLVVIVGRTNVGKSTLFNRLSVDVKSLTMDTEGVTRDFLMDTVCWQGKCFELVDTGGISLRKTSDVLLEQTRQRALHILEQASIILFVCDAKVGLLPEDREIAKLLHRMSQKTFLLLNKTDTKIGKEQLFEFDRLGFQKIIPISAQHGMGMSDLLEGIVEELPEHAKEIEEEKPKARVVILGKPNVGKSSLLNLLIQQERSIVADIPGTTREPISETIRFYKEDIVLTDTPGVRRKRKVTESLESMMVKTAFRALEDADIVLLMIDASHARIADQELKLSFYAFEEQYKAVILLFNKFDLVDEEKKLDLEFSLSKYEFFMKKIERLDISCKTEKNVNKILKTVNNVWQRYSQTFNDTQLSTLFHESLRKTPLYKMGELMRFYSAKQVKTAPITIVLHVGKPEQFDRSHFAFFDRLMRKKYDLKGVPVRFIARSK